MYQKKPSVYIALVAHHTFAECMRWRCKVTCKVGRRRNKKSSKRICITWLEYEKNQISWYIYKVGWCRDFLLRWGNFLLIRSIPLYMYSYKVLTETLNLSTSVCCVIMCPIFYFRAAAAENHRSRGWRYLSNGCLLIVSLDHPDFTEITSLTIMNPFRHSFLISSSNSFNFHLSGSSLYYWKSTDLKFYSFIFYLLFRLQWRKISITNEP